MILTDCAANAYASKANILYPGPQTRCDLLEGTQAIDGSASALEHFVGLRGVSLTSGSNVAGAAPTIDDADWTISSNGESTVYNQGVLG